MKKRKSCLAGDAHTGYAVDGITAADVETMSLPEQCSASVDGTDGKRKEVLIERGAVKRQRGLSTSGFPGGIVETGDGPGGSGTAGETPGRRPEKGSANATPEKRSSFSCSSPASATCPLPEPSRPFSTQSSSGTGLGFSFKEKRGIIYICRIPPRMTRTALRRYFERFGRLGRLHISGDGEKTGAKKRGSTGRSSRNSDGPKEGWLEFEDKKVARRVVRLLDGQMVGGKKRKCRWREDLWGLRYLRGFTWQQLIEEKVYKHRVREAKLNAALSQVKKENTLYLELVEEQKRIMKMEEKRKRKAERDGEKAAGEGDGSPGSRRYPADNSSDNDGEVSLSKGRQTGGQRTAEKKEGKKKRLPASEEKAAGRGITKVVCSEMHGNSRKMLKEKVETRGSRAIDDSVLDQFVL